MQYQQKVFLVWAITLTFNLVQSLYVYAMQVEQKEKVVVETFADSIEELEDVERQEKQYQEQYRQQQYVSRSIINQEPEIVVLLNLELEQEQEPELEPEPEEQTEFSEEDIVNLSCLVFAESGNQKTEGKISVAAVVINRKRDNVQFEEEDTIDEVIFAKRAFANIKNIDFSEAKSEGCYDAVIEAVNEEDPTEELLWDEAERLGLDPEIYAEGGALYFYNPDYCSEEELQKRNNIKCKVQIGDHIFYKVWDQ